jgi:hypothetical protein
LVLQAPQKRRRRELSREVLQEPPRAEARPDPFQTALREVPVRLLEELQ